MPDFRFVCSESTVQPSSGYASRIPPETWAYHEDLIRRLHACGTTRDDILHVLMVEHDFQPSVGQLRDKMARWGLRSSKNTYSVTSSEFSGSSCGRSDSTHNLITNQPQTIHDYAYVDAPDNCFVPGWQQYEMGTMQLDTAIQMETLAYTLFLGKRYTAAFNLYSSIYYGILFVRKSGDTDLAAIRFRSLLGCLRSCANVDQRQQIVLEAEKEIEGVSWINYCKPNGIDRQPRDHANMPFMGDLSGREDFLYTISAPSSANTRTEAFNKIYFDESRVTALNWCLNRLNAPTFATLYNSQYQRSSSGLAHGTSNVPQSTIYWYFLVDMMDNPCDDVPQLTIRYSCGRKYTLLPSETVAVIAATITSNIWLFSMEQLPLEGLQEWTKKLLSADSTLFETIFKRAIEDIMVPSFIHRLNRAVADTSANTIGQPVYRMASADLIRAIAPRLTLGQSIPTSLDHISTTDTLNKLLVFPDSGQATYKDLVREYTNVLKSYIDMDCAYGTRYEFRLRSQQQPQVNAVSPRTRNDPRRIIFDRYHVIDPRDIMLTSSLQGSARSFRSFQSTILRAEQMVETPSNSETNNLDNDEFDFNKLFPP